MEVSGIGQTHHRFQSFVLGMGSNTDDFQTRCRGLHRSSTVGPTRTWMTERDDVPISVFAALRHASSRHLTPPPLIARVGCRKAMRVPTVETLNLGLARHSKDPARPAAASIVDAGASFGDARANFSHECESHKLSDDQIRTSRTARLPLSCSQCPQHPCFHPQ